MIRTVLLAALAVTAPGLAVAQQFREVKPRLELAVFLADKPVGAEVLRSATGGEANYFSTEARLKDKVAKVWREFKQRTHLQLTTGGEVAQFDRWIDVPGATQSTKLFNFGGQWRIAVTDAAVEGKKPKPKVTDVKVDQPFVVLDERLPALVVVAVERIGDKAEAGYVRIDDATAGVLTHTSERLVSSKGDRYTRDRLAAKGIDLWVLRDAGGKVVAVQGLSGWRAVAVGAKVPADLKPDDDPPAAPPAAPAPK